MHKSVASVMSRFEPLRRIRATPDDELSFEPDAGELDRHDQWT